MLQEFLKFTTFIEVQTYKIWVYSVTAPKYVVWKKK